MNILEIQRIQLGKHSKNIANAQAFMMEFEESSSANPLNDRSRIFNDTVIELSIDRSRGRIHIHDIRAIYPGAGAGSRALIHLTRLADKHRVDLEGYAFAYSNSGTHQKLANWYKKHGFSVGPEEDDGGYQVVYNHKPVDDNTSISLSRDKS